MAFSTEDDLRRLSQLSLNETAINRENNTERIENINKGVRDDVTIAETEEAPDKNMEDDLENQLEIMETANTVNLGESDLININNNSGTVVIDLGIDFEDNVDDRHSKEKKQLRDSIAIRRPTASAVTKRKKSTKLKDRRKLRQTLIPFQKCKSRITKNKPYSKRNREVNIFVTNNSGNIVIGDGTACHASHEEYSSRQHRDGRDGEEVVADGMDMSVSPQRRLVVRVDRSIIKWLDKFYQITNEIYPLRDNGRWEEFYNTVDKRIKIAKEKGRLEEEIFMTIEKSTALSYQKRNGQSMEIVKQANDMITNARGLKMKEFLTVMSHCQLAALYRRENKMFKANQAVIIAEQNAEFVPSYLAKAYVTYEKASNQVLYLSIVSTQEPDREDYEKEAKEDLKSCISLCENMMSENDGIYLRRHQFCFVKLALMNLNCRTTNARSQSVSEDSIREATDCILRMQRSYSEEMSEATSILFLTAQCDHKFRTGDFPNALLFGNQALAIAERLGFHLEIKELQERLKSLEHQQPRLANLTEIDDL